MYSQINATIKGGGNENIFTAYLAFKYFKNAPIIIQLFTSLPNIFLQRQKLQLLIE